MSFSGVLLSGSSLDRFAQAAAEAEQLGYDSGWYAEVSGPDAVTVLAAAASRTARIRLATGIVPIYARDPYLMAMTLASLQDWSGGRVIAGFGTSTPAIITGWHGLPFEKPIRTTREYVGLVRQLLAGERVKSDGIYAIRGASIRAAAPSPVPVYLGALNPRMLELAGEVADGVILNFPTIPYATRALESVHRGLERAGRPRQAIDIVANFRTGLSSGFDDIANPLRRELITYFLAPVYQKVFTADGYAKELEQVTGLWASGDRAGAVAAIPDQFVDDHGVIGDEPGARAKVQRFLDLGIDHAVLFPVVPDGAGWDGYLRTMKALSPVS